MGRLRALAKDTAIYGMSSIVGRFINYLLVPLYTARISAESGGYGVITNIYSYVALMLVILTYGMETSFFRFANKAGADAQKVYATTLASVGFTSVLFVAVVLLFLSPISSAMGYASHPSYVWVMAVTVAIDAFQCIPFAYLRYKKRALKFAALKLLFIGMNLSMNIIAFVALPSLTGHATDVGYAFYINLACTAAITLFLRGELRDAFVWSAGKKVDLSLLREMLRYGWPILVLGLAGILNQTVDKILFPYLYKEGDALAQLGIYGAATKIAMIMALITQAFRYAYEPFVFAEAGHGADNRAVCARAMKYFVIFTLLAFLAVCAYINILRYIIGRDYWPGLRMVPAVMLAEMMMGVYFNLSFWYKLTDRTVWGAVFSGIGCAVLVAINVVGVPRWGYAACAAGGVGGYGTAMVLSYVVGQHYYPISYPLKDILLYVLLAAALFVGITTSNKSLPVWGAVCVNTVAVALFGAVAVRRDIDIRSFKGINKIFHKRTKA